MQTFYYTYATPGFYSVGLRIETVVDTSIIYLPVDVYPLPNVGFWINNPSQNLLINNFMVIDTTNISPVESLVSDWYFGDGGTASTDTAYHTYAAAANYNIKLVVTSSHLCKDSITQTVTVYTSGALVPNFSFDTVCQGNLTTLTSTSIHSDPILTYNWALDNDSLFNDNPGDSIVQKVFPNGGITYVGLEVITAFDTQQTFIPIYVLNSPVADFTINMDPQIIYSNNYAFTNTTTLPLPDTFSSYWEYGDGGFTFAKDPVYTYLLAGTYDVKLVVTSNNGCKDSIIKQVNVLDVIFNVDFSDTLHCFGDTTIFTNKTTIQNDTILMYLWDFGDGFGLIDTNAKHKFDSQLVYNVKLVALSKHGYKDSIIKAITISLHPVINLAYSGVYYFFVGDTVMIYKPNNLNAKILGVFDSLLWSTGSTADNITVDTTGKYSVFATDLNGCSSDTSFFLRVLVRDPKLLTYRNVLTPNGDGINDVWRILKFEMYYPAKITIFNRWGMEVYSNADYRNDWNGEYKGDKLPQGTYYYIIETNDNQVFKGAVNILR